jgi:hypothetical protein
MGSFGDLLSDDNKKLIVSATVQIGEVYRMHLTDKEGVKPKKTGDDGRDKYFIVLGIDEDIAVGAILINTNINENLPVYLKNLHYPLNVSDYPFLKQNRYACCDDLKSIDMKIFAKLFKKPKGIINYDDLDLIKGAVASSPISTPKILKQFGLIT